jgi:hypothetical protein
VRDNDATRTLEDGTPPQFGNVSIEVKQFRACKICTCATRCTAVLVREVKLESCRLGMG